MNKRQKEIDEPEVDIEIKGRENFNKKIITNYGHMLQAGQVDKMEMFSWGVAIWSLVSTVLLECMVN